MFKADERITINGFLAAYEGEEMSEEEAQARGITDYLADKSEMDKSEKPKTVADLKSEAAALGLDVLSRAKKEDIQALIDAANEEKSDSENDESDDEENADPEKGEE